MTSVLIWIKNLLPWNIISLYLAAVFCKPFPGHLKPTGKHSQGGTHRPQCPTRTSTKQHCAIRPQQRPLCPHYNWEGT